MRAERDRILLGRTEGDGEGQLECRGGRQACSHRHGGGHGADEAGGGPQLGHDSGDEPTPRRLEPGDFRRCHIERDGGDRLELVRREHHLASAELAVDLDEPVDSCRQHEPACVVGVVTDQVDPTGSTHAYASVDRHAWGS